VLSAEAELLKLGRRLAVGRVTIRNEPGGEIVAHASMTYSLPPAAPAA
jgi:acyl-coenzyme A thioesterase PaaI-like protein